MGQLKLFGVIRARQAVNPLIDLLRKDKSNEVRWAAEYSLALIGDETAISMLVTALRDTDKYVRYGAAAALDIFGWEPKDTPMRAYYYIAKPGVG